MSECARSRSSTSTRESAGMRWRPARSRTPQSAARQSRRRTRPPISTATRRTTRRRATHSSWASKAAARATSHTGRVRRFWVTTTTTMMMMPRHRLVSRRAQLFSSPSWSVGPGCVRWTIRDAGFVVFNWWIIFQRNYGSPVCRETVAEYNIWNTRQLFFFLGAWFDSVCI